MTDPEIPADAVEALRPLAALADWWEQALLDDDYVIGGCRAGDGSGREVRLTLKDARRARDALRALSARQAAAPGGETFDPFDVRALVEAARNLVTNANGHWMHAEDRMCLDGALEPFADAVEVTEDEINARYFTPSASVERWRHVKRGTVYEVIARGEAQDATGSLIEGASVVVYRGEDGKVWVRQEDEFADGRFERLADGEGAK